MDKNSRLLATIVWLSILLSVLTGLLNLSFWQYNRGIEKQSRSERILQLKHAESLSLSTVVTLADTTQFTSKESINDFPVTINGDFNEQFIFLLDNQVNKRSLGYRVLQVVETQQYSVLVNLGWIVGSIDRSIIPRVKPVTGQHTFNGHVRLIEEGIMLTEQDFSQLEWPLRIQQIEIDKFSKLINKPLLPFVVYVSQDEALGFEKNWQPIVMPAEKHFAYAFQWAALSLTWLVLMIFLKLKMNNNQFVSNALAEQETQAKTTDALHNG